MIKPIPDGFSGSRLHYDDSEDRLIVENVQDVEPVLEQNKALQNDGDGFSPSRNMKRVASIPNVVYWDLKKRGIVDDPVKFKQWLNDHGNRHFRTSLGAV